MAIAALGIVLWPMVEFEADDAQMHLDVYRNADPEEDLGHFEDQR